MSKLLRQNIGGTDYTMTGCALSATCATAAATAAKVAELIDGDVLADGMSVAIQFTNGNTAASPLTLTVGGVTANICDSRGQNIGGNIWQAGNVVTFLYTFGKFLLLNCAVDTVALNNMNSVSSNAVYNATKVIENAPWNVSGAVLPVHYAFLRRLGKVARLDMRFLKEEESTLPSGALVQLPAGYRPISIAQVYSGNWANDYSPLIVQIQNDGWLSIFGDVGKTVSRIDFYIGVSFLLP